MLMCGTPLALTYTPYSIHGTLFAPQGHFLSGKIFQTLVLSEAMSAGLILNVVLPLPSFQAKLTPCAIEGAMMMTTTTDMQTWLLNVSLQNPGEVYTLYQAVKDSAPRGIFDCAQAERHVWLIKCGRLASTLQLTSAKAKERFLALIHCCYADPELEMDTWYRYNQATAIQTAFGKS